jgi:hypothetical protein
MWLLVAVSVVASLAFAWLVVRAWRASSLRSAVVAPGPVALAGQGLEVPRESLPPPGPGHDFSVAFWLMLRERRASQKHALVLARGGTASDLRAAHVVAYLDACCNTLHFAVRTAPLEGAQTLQSVHSASCDVYRRVSVRYVPLGRWVHIACVVRDHMAWVQLDGSVVSSVSTLRDSAPGCALTFARPDGRLTVGVSEPDPDVQGEVAGVALLARPMLPSQVASMASWRVGLPTSALPIPSKVPRIGIRTPIYVER